MKKLNLNPTSNLGGHRLSVNDLYTLQQGNDNLGTLIASILGTAPSGGLVIAGAEQYSTDGSSFQTDAGWLYYNNEIWRIVAVPTTAIPTPNTGALYLKLNKAPLNTPVVYQSGAQFQVHVENQAILEWYGSPPSGDYIPMANVSFDNIKAAFAPIEAAWTEIDTALLSTYLRPDNDPNKLDAANSFYKYKQIGKTLFLQAKITTSQPTNVVDFYIAVSGTASINTEQPSLMVHDTASSPQVANFNAVPLPRYTVVRTDSSVGAIHLQTIIHLD